ncbi:hypothetical protein AGMMS49938_07980 [Fibrobacterales bacterium]|nr:hypothetical protein AGMMS49938_07980 [Fibrobacterales bacterium]
MPILQMLQPKICRVEPLGGYKLLLYYETNKKKVFDVSPYISGSWYGHLKDLNYFKSVRLCDNGFGVEWSEGQDIAPHELYDGC